MQHKEYWIKRFDQLTDAQLKKGSAYYYNLQEQYRKAIDNIEKDIAKWYARYATENGITLTAAKRLLNGRELAEFRMNIKEYIEKGESLDPKWAKQLETASVRVHVSRLEALKIQMQQQAENVCGGQVDGLDKLARDIYTDGYYKTAYEVQKGVGVGFDLMQLDTNRIDKLISKPWAADGKNFSERVWQNRAQLVSELENTLTQSLIRGQSPKKVIADIAQRFNVSRNKAGRLIMTESAFFAAAAQKDCFSDLGVEKYEIVATLDSRTSETCRHLDGKVIPMADYKPGVTAPPFHVYCRSTTVPYFDDEFIAGEQRAARDANSKYYTVRADMKYPEWKEKFVDGGSKEGLELMANSFRPKYEKAKAVTIGEKEIPLNKVTNSEFNMYADISEGRRSKAVRLAEKNLQQIQEMLPAGFELPKIAVVDMEKHFGVDAIGGYHSVTGVMFINSKYDTVDKITAYITKTAGEFSNTTAFAPYLHELGHKYYYDCIKKLAKKGSMSYNKAKGVMDNAISEYIHQNNNNGRFLINLSEYAERSYGLGKVGEVVAESLAAQDNVMAKDILRLIKG